MTLPLTIFFIALAAITAVYSGILMTFVFGLRKLKFNHYAEQKKWPSVSVIVPARNEAEVLERTLNSLLAQQYEGDWEIMVVDDRSTDQTPFILAELQQREPRLKVVTVIEKNPPSPKKNALATGIAASSGEIIVTTDADCIYDPMWLKGMVSHMSQDAGVVAGLTIFDLPQGTVPAWQKIQWLDFFVQNFLAAGAMGLNHPASCNGSNLAFRRAVYSKISGWGKFARVVSGDDVLFAQRVGLETDWKVVFAATPETIVRSLPVETFRELMHQRLRWASKGLSYRGSMLAFLFGVYFYHLALIAAPIAGVFNPASWAWIIGIIAGKTAMDYAVVRQGCRIFRQERLLPYFLPFAFVQTFFIPFFGFAGLLLPYRWKGGWYRTARLPRTMSRNIWRIRRFVRSRRQPESTLP
ncbi:glycosyltransferase [bacterium]|nr:glycosyltransferase [bacterium]MBU1636325.1 glycosyltransferase [bacterium]MBU1921506.1 glycosyltransferase [bacterium]